MRFQDIPGQIINIRVNTTEPNTKRLKEQPVLSVSASLPRPGEFEIQLEDAVVFVKPTVNADIRRLGNELADGRAILARLVNPAKDGSIELQVAFFAGECLEMDNIEIGVDKYVEEAVAKIARQQLSGKSLYEALERRCCLKHGNKQFFFLLAGPAIDDALKVESEKKPKEEQEEINDTEEAEESYSEMDLSIQDAFAPKPIPTRKNSLCIVGDGVRFVATETKLSDNKSIFIVTK